jgi:acetyl-CoA C-acetyltransferase
MGSFAEDCAQTLGLSRQAQDAFALTSLARAQTAINEGRFLAEITPVMTKDRSGPTKITTDEAPGLARPDKIARLKPAFREGGTVTAANSSSISDGAAALVLMSDAQARLRGLPPLARIVGQTGFAGAPHLFPTAPIGAIQKLFVQTGWTAQDVDLFEINEAFAVVTMAATIGLGLDPERVNVNGGACALGHPIGASGARVLVTLIHALRARNLRRGVAALCIGGGEATAMAVEIMG